MIKELIIKKVRKNYVTVKATTKGYGTLNLIVTILCRATTSYDLDVPDSSYVPHSI